MTTTANEFTLNEKTAISRAFSAGSYANAYETECIDDVDLDGVEAALLERLPTVILEFRAAMESIGFAWPVTP